MQDKDGDSADIGEPKGHKEVAVMLLEKGERGYAKAGRPDSADVL